jgi:hypothetical protein
MPPRAGSIKMRTRLQTVWAAFCAALHGGWGGFVLWRGFVGGRAIRSPVEADGMPREPQSTRTLRSLTPSTSGGHACCHLRSACWGPLNVRPSKTSNVCGSAMTVCGSVGCVFFHGQAHGGWPHLRTAARLVQGQPCGGAPPRATPLATPPASPTRETASVREAPGYRTASARA